MAKALFDYPRNLQITLYYPQDKTEVIDIEESLHKDPCNIGHPLIVHAVSAYATAIRYPSGTDRDESGTIRLSKRDAERNLKRVFRAMAHDPRASETQRLIPQAEFAAREYGSRYFETLLDTLRKREVRAFRRDSLRIERIGQLLKEVFPETDHNPILSFLRDHYDKDKTNLS